MTDTSFLYLDFDGPLHHHDVYLMRGRPVCREGELFAHCSLLVPVLEEFPDVRIVLSTSWVRVMGFGRAKKRLPVKIQERVVGATWHKAMRGPAWNTGMYVTQAGTEYAFIQLSRYEQILQDTQRRNAARWLALDDDDDGWPDDERDHLVYCDPVLGLAEPGKTVELRERLAAL